MLYRSTSIRSFTFHTLLVLSVAFSAACPESGSVNDDADAAAPDDAALSAADAASVELDAAAAPADSATIAADGGTAIVPYTAALSTGEWANMDFSARKQFMREMVMPTIRPLFSEFDAVKFASMKCTTCHGSGAAAGTYDMPNADLPALGSESLANPDNQLIVEFMRNVIKPKMAELLGEQTAPALRCSACHTSTP
jgi:hypothetical protein